MDIGARLCPSELKFMVTKWDIEGGQIINCVHLKTDIRETCVYDTLDYMMLESGNHFLNLTTNINMGGGGGGGE